MMKLLEWLWKVRMCLYDTVKVSTDFCWSGERGNIETGIDYLEIFTESENVVRNLSIFSNASIYVQRKLFKEGRVASVDLNDY